jgi:hypothetical protein
MRGPAHNKKPRTLVRPRSGGGSADGEGVEGIAEFTTRQAGSFGFSGKGLLFVVPPTYQEEAETTEKGRIFTMKLAESLNRRLPE